MTPLEIQEFIKHLALIEEFFVEMAANEEQVNAFGFKAALQLPSAEAAFDALRTFNEDFSTFKYFAERFDTIFGAELNQLNATSELLEQVSLINLRLRMGRARRRLAIGVGATQTVFDVLLRTFRIRLSTRNDLFKEVPITLHKAILGLERVRALATRLQNALVQRNAADDEFFKPSNVQVSQVVILIDRAAAEIENINSLSPMEIQRLKGYLEDAKSEALSAKPSWSKIVGALVIVSAVVSGLADAPSAAKNVRDAIDYILGTSMPVPARPRLMPAPSNEILPPSAPNAA